MYKCKHFNIKELVGPDTFNSTPEWKLWNVLDPQLLRLIDALREDFGESITINDWSWGGRFTESGLRVPGMKHYSSWSLHSWGHAFDLKFKHTDAWTMRQQIKLKFDAGDYAHIIPSATFEEGPKINWVHLDNRNAGSDGYNSFIVN